MIEELIKWSMIPISIFIILIIIGYIATKLENKKEQQKLTLASLDQIDKMTGTEFEYFLEILFKQFGYTASVTSGSHDYGADLILHKDGKKIVVQAKRYAKNRKVGIAAIQQIHSAGSYYEADECWAFTNSHFTKSAIDLANACGVMLFERSDLTNFTYSLDQNFNQEKKKEPVVKEEQLELDY